MRLEDTNTATVVERRVKLGTPVGDGVRLMRQGEPTEKPQWYLCYLDGQVVRECFAHYPAQRRMLEAAGNGVTVDNAFVRRFLAAKD